MLCQNCGNNEANIHYTQIINGVKKEISLCSACAKELGIEGMEIPDFPINFNSFLGDFFNDYVENELLPSFQTEDIKCKNCGMTYDDFIKTGMFGCSECYNTFSNLIDSLLKNLHGTAKHIGRKPKKIKGNIESKESKIETADKDENEVESDENQAKIEKVNYEKIKLERELEQAIKDERYEDAAKYRDELKKFEDKQ